MDNKKGKIKNSAMNEFIRSVGGRALNEKELKRLLRKKPDERQENKSINEK